MIKFWKAHAYGNDFLYVEHSAVDGVALDVLAREICDRHTGVGADGLIVFQRTRDGAAMRLFNSAGGRAEVSGNGVRALAALLARDEMGETLELAIATEGGVKRLTRTRRTDTHQTFRASMGQPAGLKRQPLSAGGESLTLAVLS